MKAGAAGPVDRSCAGGTSGGCTRRRALLAGGSALGGLLALLAGCQSAWLGPRSIHVDRARIEAALTRRFPYDTRWLGLFEVRAETPQLSLLPQRNRIGAEMEIQVTERLFGKALRGQVDFDGGLRWDTASHSLRLVDVEVGRVAVAGLPDAAAAQTGRLAVLLAEQLLDGRELFTLDEAQRAELRRRGVAPGAVTVTERGIDVALDPLPPAR